jgi:hypothetical protein
MSDKIVENGITKEDIKNIKACDTLVYRLRDGRELLECYYHASDKRTGFSYNIPIAKREYVDSEKFYTCYASSQNKKYNKQVLSLIELLKEGDVIHYNWYTDKLTNGYLHQNNLSGDVLELVIVRNKKSLIFDLEIMITKSDSSSRMIKLKEGAYNG